MKHSKLVLGGLCASLSFMLGCSASSGGSKLGGPGAGGSGATGAGGSAASGGYGNTPGVGGGSNGGNFNLGGTNGGGSGGGATNCTQTDPNVDGDGDGFTPAQGDCNDCDPNTNPGAYDVPGDNIDEDCDGTPDNAPVNCDGNIPDIGYNDPMAAARAIGLCQTATQTGKKWGVISAAYVKADGSTGMNPLSHGLLPNFGPNVHVQEGKNMLMLSSGTARRPGDPGYVNAGTAPMGTTSQTPPGFPIDSPSCSVKTANDHNANDPAGLQLSIRVPTNAKSFSFQFDFYTWEFPIYVCTQYNDFFVVLQNPAPPNAQFSNISFDSKGDPVSVNNGFLEVCSPQTAGGKTFTCSKGTAELQGTGYEGHAATGWLETQSPVQPGSVIQLRFAVWDMGDHILSSSALIDKFQWSVKAASSPGTKPVPVPQ